MKKELWLRLRNYHFDQVVPPQMFDHVLAAFGRTDASTKAFASKIARKHEWTNTFSLRAVEEYKKFVFLGMVSEFPVTPPRVIDQVWHEHILFSRAYREFCRDVLRRDFDHNPELLPSAEQTDVFKLQFDATLDLYAKEFNREPPVDIWGIPKFGGRRKRSDSSDSSSTYVSSDTPLYLHFDGGSDSANDAAGFGGGGGFSGGGGESSWGDAPSGDAGSSGDSGSDGGGSGCSSGCGGGGE